MLLLQTSKHDEDMGASAIFFDGQGGLVRIYSMQWPIKTNDNSLQNLLFRSECCEITGDFVYYLDLQLCTVTYGISIQALYPVTILLYLRTCLLLVLKPQQEGFPDSLGI